jgi:hypothetical protein
MGPALSRAQQQGIWSPPKTKSRVVSIGQLKEAKIRIPTVKEAIAKHLPALLRMVDAGKTDSKDVLATLQQALTDRKRDALHLVPVRLRADGKYKDEVRVLYKDTRVDATKVSPKGKEYYVLKGYGKPGEPSAVVDPVHLELDIDRILVDLNKLTKKAAAAVKVTNLPPLDAASVAALEARARELWKQHGPPPVKIEVCGYTPEIVAEQAKPVWDGGDVAVVGVDEAVAVKKPRKRRTKKAQAA